MFVLCVLVLCIDYILEGYTPEGIIFFNNFTCQLYAFVFKHERDLARPGVYLPAAVRMGATTINQGGGPFSYSGTEPRSGMIQVYWSSLQYIPRTNSLRSRGSTKHI